MNFEETYKILGEVDIYIIDQILKHRFLKEEIILDAGCGNGRNLKWFYQNNFKIYGIDQDLESINYSKTRYPKMAENFYIGNLDHLPFPKNYFDHVICSAVLHFAKDEEHFHQMMKEILSVLKVSGILFIRVASNIGLRKKPFVKDSLNNAVSSFYITRKLISKITEIYSLELIEPVKTTNVNDIRAMTTLVFKKLKD